MKLNLFGHSYIIIINMNALDEYMQQDIYGYLNICDKVKCKKYEGASIETFDDKAILCYDCRIRYGGDDSILELIYYTIGRTKEEKFWRFGLTGACRAGHIEVVKIMIDRGADSLCSGLYGACCGGHVEILELLILKGAHNWNYGLYGACRGGHVAIVEMMIKKGATVCFNCGKSMADHLKK